MALKDDMNMLGRSQEAADSLGRVGTKPIGNPVGMEQAQSTVLGYAPTQLERADNGGVQAVGTGASGTVGAVSSGAEGAGTDGQVKVPTQEDLRIKGYMGAFSDLVPKASYADDVKRQEKMALFNLLANMGKVGMQTVASKFYGEHKFDPIQDNSAKIQENIERFKALQRAADDKRNGTLLSLAIQQRDKDDAAKRADAQMQYQKERAAEQMQYQRERALAQDRDSERNYNLRVAQMQEESSRFAKQFGLSAQRAQADMAVARQQLQKLETENKPMMLFSTDFGNVYLDNPSDARALVFAMLRELESAGDAQASDALAKAAAAVGEGNARPSRYDSNSYEYAYAYVNRKMKENPEAAYMLINMLTNKDALMQNSTQRKAYNDYLTRMKAAESAAQHSREAAGENGNGNGKKVVAPIQTGASGRNGDPVGSGGQTGSSRPNTGSSGTNESVWVGAPSDSIANPNESVWAALQQQQEDSLKRAGVSR